jgi:putative transposase
MNGSFTAPADARAFAQPCATVTHDQLPTSVDRKFVADAPNKLWVADITYAPTYTGSLFLAIVLDAFNRRVVGWETSSNMKTQLVLDALNMAIYRRRPIDVVHHSE